MPLSAAERIVRDATGADPGTSLRPMTTGRYLYPDKEHLFFFIFALEVPEIMHFPRRSEMHEFRVSELVAIRACQVLAAAVRVCRRTDLSPRAFAAAAEVLALNLALHDHPDLADLMGSLTDKPADDHEQAAETLSGLIIERSAPSWIEPSHEVPLEGPGRLALPGVLLGSAAAVCGTGDRPGRPAMRRIGRRRAKEVGTGSALGAVSGRARDRRAAT